MKKKINLLIISMLFSCLVYSQADHHNADIFYNELINDIGFDKQTPVLNHTSLTVIKRVNLKDDNLRWTNVETTGIARGEKTFLKQIDINKFSEEKLLQPIGKHPFTNKMPDRNQITATQMLILSPIIYSKDKQLAICSIFEWSGPEESSETIYLLAYIGHKWKIIKFLGVTIS